MTNIKDLKEDDIVFCTVIKIEGTTVFVDIDEYGPGTIVFSEIAAGRIRNLREYVTPNKKIVCKVLRIVKDHIELSIRRVTAKERQTLLEKYKTEKTFSSLLKTISIDHEKIISKIKKSHDLSDFIEDIKEDSKLLESYLPKDKALSLSKILLEKRESSKKIKRIFSLTSNSPKGLEDIKSILSPIPKDTKINYLGSSNFSISITGKNPKKAEKELSLFLQLIEKKAKQKHALFSMKEK